MEFEQIERIDNEKTGTITVNITIPPSTVTNILSEFYDAVSAHKNLQKDTSWEIIDKEATKTMTPDTYKELRRDFVVNKATSEALKKLDVVPELTPRICVLEYPQQTESFSFDISVIERPSVVLSSYVPVEIEAEDVVLTEEMVDYRIESLLEEYAEFVPADAHAVTKNDCIKIDIATLLKGKTVPHLTGKGFVLELSDGSMPDSFVKSLMGMNVGETKTFDYAVTHERAITNNEVDVYTTTVTVLEQLSKQIPELTNEWVEANIEHASTVEEFREGVIRMMNNEIEGVNRDTHARLANIELANRLEGNIPDELFQTSRDGLMRRLERELAEKGQTIDDYYEENHMNEEELSVHMLIKSAENLRQGFALEALFDGRHMKLTDSSLQYSYKEMFRCDAPAISDLKKSEKYHLVQRAAKRMIALNWLVDTATIKEHC